MIDEGATLTGHISPKLRKQAASHDFKLAVSATSRALIKEAIARPCLDDSGDTIMGDRNPLTIVPTTVPIIVPVFNPSLVTVPMEIDEKFDKEMAKINKRCLLNVSDDEEEEEEVAEPRDYDRPLDNDEVESLCQEMSQLRIQNRSMELPANAQVSGSA